jgi:AbrB family looped-hinge helix DNA binding protein
LETEIVVKKKGQTTIPARIRKKFKIEEGTRLEVMETDEGILLKPKKSIWDMIGAYSHLATVEEVNEQLYRLRHEVDPDDEQS